MACLQRKSLSGKNARQTGGGKAGLLLLYYLLYLGSTTCHASSTHGDRSFHFCLCRGELIAEVEGQRVSIAQKKGLIDLYKSQGLQEVSNDDDEVIQKEEAWLHSSYYYS